MEKPRVMVKVEDWQAAGFVSRRPVPAVMVLGPLALLDEWKVLSTA
jgi:hypothetical protein